MNEDLRKRVLEKVRGIFGERVTAEAGPALAAFIEDVRTIGAKTHLVGRGNLESNIEAQIIDSAMMLEIFQEAGGARRRIADIGSGAGFPGIIWKVLNPELEITLIERKSKMAAFLSRETARLGLKDIHVYPGDASMAEFEPFEAVVSKAAGKLNEILPVAEKLLERDGIYITIKSPYWEKSRDRTEMQGMRLEENESATIERGRVLVFRKL